MIVVFLIYLIAFSGAMTVLSLMFLSLAVTSDDTPPKVGCSVSIIVFLSILAVVFSSIVLARVS